MQFDMWGMFKAMQALNIKPIKQQPLQSTAAEASTAAAEDTAAEAAAAAEPAAHACVPVTDVTPPPGWSYYYDSKFRRGSAAEEEAKWQGFTHGQQEEWDVLV
jgi:hypothetical protein